LIILSVKLYLSLIGVPGIRQFTFQSFRERCNWWPAGFSEPKIVALGLTRLPIIQNNLSENDTPFEIICKEQKILALWSLLRVFVTNNTEP